MYTSKILYIPLFIAMFLLLVCVIIGISVYFSKEDDYQKNSSNRRLNGLSQGQCNCCCQCCYCNCCTTNNNTENTTQDEHEKEHEKESTDSLNYNSDSDISTDSEKESKKDDNNTDSLNYNSDSDISTESEKESKKDDDIFESSKKKHISKLKKYEKSFSISIFSLTLFFYFELYCFLSKYALAFTLNWCFYTQFFFTIAPLGISFVLNLVLFIIRIKCQNNYLFLFGSDSFTKLNGFLIFINIFQIFLIILIYFFLILIFCVSNEKLCNAIDTMNSEICCRECCNCCFPLFFAGIFAKEEDSDDSNRHNSTMSKFDNSNNILDIINKEKPPNIPNKKKSNNNSNIQNINISPNRSYSSSIEDIINQEKPPNFSITGKITSKKELLKNPPININPEGLDCEIYKKNILLSQKILIVMTYYEDSCNINKLFENGDNKTVKDAVSHFGIEIVAVDNYEDAIKEITKDENGKCPYYACWLLNSEKEKSNLKQFLELLIKFWKNGGAVVLFSDNTPFIVETNMFLSMISAGFIMDGDYVGQKEIYGDETGLLKKPALFNRKKDFYKFNNIQRQGLCHNLYNIYEGVTISSITKKNKRKMKVKQNDIKPFIPFARDSEGGITSLLKLANDSGEGDLILDGGFTKLFINMKENGTFRYVQNIAGFTARPEVHISQNVVPKDYRPRKVSL